MSSPRPTKQRVRTRSNVKELKREASSQALKRLPAELKLQLLEQALLISPDCLISLAQTDSSFHTVFKAHENRLVSRFLVTYTLLPIILYCNYVLTRLQQVLRDSIDTDPRPKAWAVLNENPPTPYHAPNIPLPLALEMAKTHSIVRQIVYNSYVAPGTRLAPDRDETYEEREDWLLLSNYYYLILFHPALGTMSTSTPPDVILRHRLYNKIHQTNPSRMSEQSHARCGSDPAQIREGFSKEIWGQLAKELLRDTGLDPGPEYALQIHLPQAFVYTAGLHGWCAWAKAGHGSKSREARKQVVMTVLKRAFGRGMTAPTAAYGPPTVVGLRNSFFIDVQQIGAANGIGGGRNDPWEDIELDLEKEGLFSEDPDGFVFDGFGARGIEEALGIRDIMKPPRSLAEVVHFCRSTPVWKKYGWINEKCYGKHNPGWPLGKYKW